MTTRRTMNPKLLVLVLALPLMALACASEPTTEIAAAEQAVQSARDAEAGSYAPEAMQAAEEAYAALETELAAQKETFALRRSYDKARELAGTTVNASDEASSAARAGRDQAREQASNLLAELRTDLEEVTELVQHAPAGKGSASDLAALRGDLGSIEVALTDIEQAIAAERFMDAVQKARAAMESTNEIRTDVERAMEARRTARSRS